jgi:hypothetical protein
MASRNQCWGVFDARGVVRHLNDRACLGTAMEVTQEEDIVMTTL